MRGKEGEKKEEKLYYFPYLQDWCNKMLKTVCAREGYDQKW